MVTNNIPRLPDWKELYKLAVMELDTAKLPQRITDARNAILDRAEETFAKRGNYHESHTCAALTCNEHTQHLHSSTSPEELTDALNGLRVMQREYERREWENGQRGVAMRKMS